MDFDIFCDESRHIERDKFRYMVLGGIWCERQFRREISRMIEDMKKASDFAGELKWTKVTPQKITLFKNIIQLFFTNNNLSFRCIVVDKTVLKHELYNPKGGHEEFYYKMYYYMLNKKICPPNTYRIFLDYKGKDNAKKVAELQDIIGHTYYDFANQIVILMQSVISNQHPILQLTDVLIGAVGYIWNDLKTSDAKLEICELIRKMSGMTTLKMTTSYSENKFEIFKINLQ
jgi:hypothetical protein